MVSVDVKHHVYLLRGLVTGNALLRSQTEVGTKEFPLLLVLHASDLNCRQWDEGLNSPPNERLWMSDAFPLSVVSGLSFDSHFLSPLLFFLPGPLALSVLSFFC